MHPDMLGKGVEGIVKSVQWWIIAPGLGLILAVIYYFVFRIVITKWNLRTPGREDDSIEADLERSAAK